MIAELWIGDMGLRLEHEDIRLLLGFRRQLDMLIGGLPPGDNRIDWSCHGDHVAASVDDDGAFLLALTAGGMVGLLNIKSTPILRKIAGPDDEQTLNE